MSLNGNNTATYMISPRLSHHYSPDARVDPKCIKHSTPRKIFARVLFVGFFL